MQNTPDRFAVWMLLALLFGICPPSTVAGESSEAVVGATADQLLELERRIAIQKRMNELRQLQLQQQEQEMKLFGNGNSKSGEPVVIQMPRVRLLSLRSKMGKLEARLRYGMRSLTVHKGELIEAGVRVADVNADGVRIDFHGSEMRLGIERGGSAPAAQMAVGR